LRLAAKTVAQRVAFKATTQPPEHWIFWCAPFDGQSAPIVLSGFASKERIPIPGTAATDFSKASLTLCGAGAVAFEFEFAIFSVNSSVAHRDFSEFITGTVEPLGFTRLWPVPGRAITVTDRRLSPLTYRDLYRIRDVVRDAVGAAYKRNQ
jgi:hypothetical protein